MPTTFGGEPNKKTPPITQTIGV
ncbi:hypothetical protein [Staphylococcus aureus]